MAVWVALSRHFIRRFEVVVGLVTGFLEPILSVFSSIVIALYLSITLNLLSSLHRGNNCGQVFLLLLSLASTTQT